MWHSRLNPGSSSFCGSTKRVSGFRYHCRYDAAKGSVTIVIQTVGYSTGKLCELNPGDMIADFARHARPTFGIRARLPGELSRKRILFVAGG